MMNRGNECFIIRVGMGGRKEGGEGAMTRGIISILVPFIQIREFKQSI